MYTHVVNGPHTVHDVMGYVGQFVRWRHTAAPLLSTASLSSYHSLHSQRLTPTPAMCCVWSAQMCSPWRMKNPSTGALSFTTSSTIVSGRRSRLPPPVCSSTASQIPPTTATDSASACSPTSTATLPSRTPGGTLAKVQYTNRINGCCTPLADKTKSISLVNGNWNYTEHRTETTTFYCIDLGFASLMFWWLYRCDDTTALLLQVTGHLSYPASSQESICITLEGRCTQNVWVTAVSSSRVATVTTTMASIPRLCVRFPVAAAWRFSTTRSLLSCWPSLSIMALRPFMSSPKCAPSAWALLR